VGSSDNELEELRRRAYGRQADIHLDPDALDRLRELEGEQARTPAVEADAVDMTAVEAAAPIVNEQDAAEAEAEADVDTASVRDVHPTRNARNVLRACLRWVSSLRRSTVVILLIAVAFVVAVAVVLTLVQRVQTNPLQAGASQVARLQVDPGYRIPDVFGGSGSGELKAKAYQNFHGLRVIVISGKQISQGPTEDCVSVYPESDITDPTSSSFQGQFFSACSAGKFPAIVQFDLRVQTLPVAIRDAVAPSTSLQFVYDKRDDEVVVFGSK